MVLLVGDLAVLVEVLAIGTGVPVTGVVVGALGRLSATGTEVTGIRVEPPLWEPGVGVGVGAVIGATTETTGVVIGFSTETTGAGSGSTVFVIGFSAETTGFATEPTVSVTGATTWETVLVTGATACATVRVIGATAFVTGLITAPTVSVTGAATRSACQRRSSPPQFAPSTRLRAVNCPTVGRRRVPPRGTDRAPG